MKRIHVYKAEREAGLDKAIRTNTSVAYSCKLETVESDKVVQPVIQNVPSFVIATNENQIDLHYLKTIMVSSGWNLNDDVFDKTELWSARATPEDKPFNYNHNPADIIGHITACQVVDNKYVPVADDLTIDEIPDNIHILTNAVLYKVFADEKLQKRIDKIIAEINQGKWFVSMEAIFTGFDYAVTQEDGKQIIVARNNETAFLTKHLRAYGGNGVYEGNKVGRLMRNLVFSGKGLVENPANPPSIILPATQAFVANYSLSSAEKLCQNKNVVYENQTDNKSKEEKLMADTLETKVAELEKTVATTQKNLEDAVNAKNAAEGKIKELELAKSTLDTELNKAQATLKSVNEELAKVKSVEVKRNRIEVLVADLSYDKEFATELYDTVASLTDEAFAKYVGVAKKKVDIAKANVSKVPVDDKTVDNADANANKDDLEKVKADKQPTMNVTDNVKNFETVQAHVSDFMSRFNKTTKESK
jgi:hypothetical protein